ncbi:DsbA family protein [Sphingomonas sp. QA11]|uniref:2-hydroxychromene-2-carboxylate isomerase n=1 Tax=Sphingomonas sp. QA11 TaxID=2950605 RepID=UPI0023494BC7|nr:DsbA family protein [Sphingomonas sp. QA11]WCM26734.1 DsbA family protein [Sphingomonas sp. QA11]
MTLTYDLYWSFRSPYSYLVTPRLVELERDHDVTANVRPVYPIAVRQPDFFTSNDPLWVSYFLRDIGRSAEFVGLPFRWASPDPVKMDMATRTYPKEQPHIHRLTHLGVAAAERGRGLAFLDEVSRLIWGGAVPDWHLGDHLAEAAGRAGLDLAEMDAAIAADPGHHVAVVEANQAAQRVGGHYGVPLMVFEGEPFFGQDRFDQLKWRMERKGLARR